jgi:hypothetical protein
MVRFERTLDSTGSDRLRSGNGQLNAIDESRLSGTDHVYWKVRTRLTNEETWSNDRVGLIGAAVTLIRDAMDSKGNRCTASIA